MGSQPAVVSHVPFSVFSQSSSLMSDRASQAMEKALRNVAPLASAQDSSAADDSQNRPEDEKVTSEPVLLQGTLPDQKCSQNNFKKRDPADLLSASALMNDKDGILTDFAMSYPPALDERGGTKDLDLDVPRVASKKFRERRNAEINHIDMRSLTVSGPSSSDRSADSDVGSKGNTTVLLKNYVQEDLDCVESALLWILREEEPVDMKHSNERSMKSRGSAELDGQLDDSEGSRISANESDMQLLSKLLNQVQSLRAQKHRPRQKSRGTSSIIHGGNSSWDITKRSGGKEKRPRKEDTMKTVEAARLAAKSAAEAARAAAASVTKNSAAIEKLLLSLNPSFTKLSAKQKKHRSCIEGEMINDSEESSAESSDSEELKKVTKKIVVQNRYTHVILAFMLVSSFVWRYIVVKVAKRVRSKVSDPLGYVGGMLSDGFKGPGKEKDATEDGSSGPNYLPKINLPSIIQGEQETEGVEGTVSDGKEERVHNFGNILQIKPDKIKPGSSR